MKINDPEVFIQKLKAYAYSFSPCVILDSCNIPPQVFPGKYRLLAAFGGNVLPFTNADSLKQLMNFWAENPRWLFGVLGYNLKNEIEHLESNNNKCFDVPNLAFFEPEHVVAITWDSEIIAFTSDQNYLFSKIEEVEIKPDEKGNLSINEDVAIDFSASTHREAVLSIQNEIVNGNVYELNLCSRFLHRNARLQNPGKLFDALIEVSPAPFSAYLNINNMFVMSASPERYILKNKNMLVCQPIKGTRPRNKNEEVDQELKRDLRFHTKDCAENVMIVDLIRNDLARVSSAGSVEVNELFGIYSFSHVHQMISTISSEIEPGKTWTDVLRATFPMGSMTGAPKIAAMKLIESFELSDREWYSGALGYIDPSGNMDFNVLIRSVFYDMEKHLLAYYAGGAITIDSNPEDEYNEMLIKASAIQSLISKLIQ